MRILHVGADRVVDASRLVALIDLPTAGQSAATREYLELAKAEGRLVDLSPKTPRTAVITDDAVLLAAPSSLTLARRLSPGDGRLA